MPLLETIGIVSSKGMEFSNMTCYCIVSNKGMEFSNITYHGIVSNKGMEFSNITCHGTMTCDIGTPCPCLKQYNDMSY
jgi:hypothetical protein